MKSEGRRVAAKARTINEVTEEIIGAAIRVHRELGPGLLESAYEACLAYELADHGLLVEQQKPLTLHYRGREIDCAYRLDLLVEGEVIVEVKSVEKLLPVHDAQLLSYLRLANCPVGLLLNFNVPVLTQGLRRLANNYRGA
jgi:GxxExxY protein